MPIEAFNSPVFGRSPPLRLPASRRKRLREGMEGPRGSLRSLLLSKHLVRIFFCTSTNLPQKPGPWLPCTDTNASSGVSSNMLHAPLLHCPTVCLPRAWNWLCATVAITDGAASSLLGGNTASLNGKATMADDRACAPSAMVGS